MPPCLQRVSPPCVGSNLQARHKEALFATGQGRNTATPQKQKALSPLSRCTPPTHSLSPHSSPSQLLLLALYSPALTPLHNPPEPAEHVLVPYKHSTAQCSTVQYRTESPSPPKNPSSRQNVFLKLFRLLPALSSRDGWRARPRRLRVSPHVSRCWDSSKHHVPHSTYSRSCAAHLVKKERPR